MTTRKNFSLSYLLLLICSFFLVGCGIPGDLYMPETYSTEPPPPPRKSRLKKNTNQTSIENTTNKENIDKGN